MTNERLYSLPEYKSGCIYDPIEVLHQALNCNFRIPHSIRDFCVSTVAWILRGAVKISSHCLQINKLDTCIMEGSSIFSVLKN